MTALELRPYQQEIFRAVIDSVYRRRGLTFSVEIARQGGKNELSAHLEKGLLAASFNAANNLIKCSPTFDPQALISMQRLEDRLDDAGLSGIYQVERGHIVRLGKARVIFLSADKSSSVVGNTAHLLLEIDESQDVSKDKYTKEFKPMGAATNVTSVHYGTTWDDNTLLEEVKQTNLELERRDGIKRHFRYDWQEVAKYVEGYDVYVEGERARLGENHPLFMTQYRLLPVHGGGGFLNAQQKAQLHGEHSRMRRAVVNKVYVAGLDIAGEEENAQLNVLTNPKRDATVLTVAELDFTGCNAVNKEPVIRVVEHFRSVGKKHPELYAQLVDLIKNVWHCRRVIVDATGVGEPVASFLRQALGSRVEPFKFTEASKSQLGFSLLAAVNSGRLKLYQGDGSPEYQEVWQEIEQAQSQYRASQTMNFYVDPAQGHDDFLMSLALTVEAARGYTPREARGSTEEVERECLKQTARDARTFI
jgi:hypothetical protein